MNLSPIRKSLMAAAGSAIFAGAAGLATGMSDGALTGAECVIAAGLAVGAFAAVGRATWLIPNDDERPKFQAGGVTVSGSGVTVNGGYVNVDPVAEGRRIQAALDAYHRAGGSRDPRR